MVHEGATTNEARRGWLAAFIFCLATFQGLTANLIPVVMHSVGREFHVSSKEQLGMLQTTFLAGGIFSLFMSGYVTDYLRAARSSMLAVIAALSWSRSPNAQ